MTDQEKLEAMRDLDKQIADAIIPLLGAEGDGLLIVRSFYALTHADGSTSGGQIGLRQESIPPTQVDDMITAYLAGEGEHPTSGMVEVPPKH